MTPWRPTVTSWRCLYSAPSGEFRRLLWPFRQRLHPLPVAGDRRRLQWHWDRHHIGTGADRPERYDQVKINDWMPCEPEADRQRPKTTRPLNRPRPARLRR